MILNLLAVHLEHNYMNWHDLVLLNDLKTLRQLRSNQKNWVGQNSIAELS
jgi:hypothetical protein